MAQSQFSQNHQQYPYRVYDLRVRYLWDDGTLDMPVAYITSTNPPVQDETHVPQAARQACEQIKVAAAQGRKIVTFYLERMQVPPIAPSPDPINPNETLLSADVQEYAPQIKPDGTNLGYRVEGTYIYSLKRPQWYKDGFRKGATDLDTTVADANISRPEEFEPGYQ